jgi:hypothetical protein
MSPPVFCEAKILHVELPSSNHLYWPELDIDLAVESIRIPNSFRLSAVSAPNETAKETSPYDLKEDF